MENQINITEREWASREYHGFAPSNNNEVVDTNVGLENLRRSPHGQNESASVEPGRFAEVLTHSAKHEFLYNPAI